LITSYYSTTTESGTIVSLFEIGKRDLPSGLQGYHIYKDNVKQNASLLASSVYAYPSAGLNEETDYSYQMTAVYDGVESPASSTLTLRLPASNHLPLTEDFSSGDFTANFWEIIPAPNLAAWKVASAAAMTDEALPSLVYSYTYNRDYEQTFVSKPLTSSAPLILLRYDVACSPRSQYNEKLNIEIEVDGTWYLIASESSASITSPQTKELDITSRVQGKSFQLRFRVSGNGGSTSYFWYLDNIRIWEPEYVRFGGVIRSVDVPAEGVRLELAKSDDTFLLYEALSGAGGDFLLPQVEKGIYRLTLSKAGETLYENSAYRIEAENTNLVLVIPAPRIQIDASPLHLLLGENKSKDISIPLSNTGNETLKWQAEMKYLSLGSGNETGNSDISEPPMWEAAPLIDFQTPREASAVFHNNHYYTMGERSYSPSSIVLREYALTGELVRSLTIATPNYILQGLVSDGTTLYEVTAPEDRGDFGTSLPGKLIPVDFENEVADENRAIVTDFDEIKSLMYAVYDPVRDEFYVGSSHAFHSIDRTGKVQKSYDITSAYAHRAALDTFSEGGPYLWLFCEKTIAGYGGNDDRANILQYSLKEVRHVSPGVYLLEVRKGNITGRYKVVVQGAR
jgi:hypothetical protein